MGGNVIQLTQHVEVHCSIGGSDIIGGSAHVHPLIPTPRTRNSESPCLRLQHEGASARRGRGGEGSPVEGPGVGEGGVREGGAGESDWLCWDG